MAFLESPRFPTDLSYGVVGGPTYKTNIIEKNSGWENANSVWPQGRHEYQLVYAAKDQVTIEGILNFFHMAKGRWGGFRFKDFADFKSCNADTTVSFTDQLVSGALDISNRNYQLIKTYTQGVTSTIRVIKKPVSGTVIVGISGLQEIHFVVDTTTGIITFDADHTAAITNATQANPCVITAANTLAAGYTVYLSGISGMTGLNSHRYSVLSATSTTFTINVDTRAMGAYSSGGVYHTLPQAGEVITAGFQFDVPVRFENDNLQVSIDSNKTRSIQNLALMEVRI